MAILSVKEFNTSRFAQMADSSDASIVAVLERAEAAIKRKLQRPIEAEQFEEVFYPNGRTIYLRYRPIVSIDEVVFAGPYPINPLYSVDTRSGVLTLVRNPSGPITVKYTAGWADPPADLKEAVAMQAVLFLYTDLEIYGVGDGKEPGIAYFKRDIEDLLKPYRQLHMAY